LSYLAGQHTADQALRLGVAMDELNLHPSRCCSAPLGRMRLQRVRLIHGDVANARCRVSTLR
jgi:hypothetical protein